MAGHDVKCSANFAIGIIGNVRLSELATLNQQGGLVKLQHWTRVLILRLFLGL